jgi:flagellar basal body rod protein FlgB
MMVTEKSATSTGLTATADEDNVSFDKDHSGLVKYESRYDQEYRIVKEKVRSLAESATSDISRRLAAEDGM